MNNPVHCLKPGEFYKDPKDDRIYRYRKVSDMSTGLMFPARGECDFWFLFRAPVAATRDDIILWVAQRANRG